jgi:hypothetical protein
MTESIPAVRMVYHSIATVDNLPITSTYVVDFVITGIVPLTSNYSDGEAADASKSMVSPGRRCVPPQVHLYER